jgi:hypothetical protein
LELLNSHFQDLTFDATFEIGSKTSSKKVSNQIVSLREDHDDVNLVKGRRLLETSVKLFESNKSN